jgi:hypothetical protein
MYRITLKSGYILTDINGRITLDAAGRHYECAPRDDWKIVGIGKRHHSAFLVSLAQAAAGESIGQGWVHDVDHGTHRMWAMPTSRRAVKVEKCG